MQISFKDSGWKIAIIKGIRNAIKSALNESAELVQAAAKANCPVDTGRLVNSIDKKVFDKYAVVFSDIHYAKFVEFGTWKMFQQPFLRPALDHNISNIKNIFKKHIKKNVR